MVPIFRPRLKAHLARKRATMVEKKLARSLARSLESRYEGDWATGLHYCWIGCVKISVLGIELLILLSYWKLMSRQLKPQTSQSCNSYMSRQYGSWCRVNWNLKLPSLVIRICRVNIFGDMQKIKASILGYRRRWQCRWQGPWQKTGAVFRRGISTRYDPEGEIYSQLLFTSFGDVWSFVVVGFDAIIVKFCNEIHLELSWSLHKFFIICLSVFIMWNKFRSRRNLRSTSEYSTPLQLRAPARTLAPVNVDAFPKRPWNRAMWALFFVWVGYDLNC